MMAKSENKTSRRIDWPSSWYVALSISAHACPAYQTAWRGNDHGVMWQLWRNAMAYGRQQWLKYQWLSDRWRGINS